MTRIVLVDDHAIVRSGYRRLLSAEPDFEVVGEAATVQEANALVGRAAPDVAIVDLSLKGSSGLEAIAGMLARQPALRVLVLSMHDDAGHLLQALKAGAHGYLTKRSEPEEVIEAIRGVMRGQRVLSQDLRGLDRHADEGAAAGDTALRDLKPREFELLRMLVQGESVQAIATVMHLSPKTVLNYLTLIRQKLNADNDFKLMHLAARSGLVEFGAAVPA
ncbi:LuxR family two component transcriptional regulator [Pseudoduganella lurida]|uniref:LuxR family two component transcriptional regulator n=1 Tax=Pseudoduganella lurida TaxID=1036180 RepID=A0A562R0L7_9BURK|nr:response regulator transcription factor [Pseudoduganella lurida]TWI62615.1 LuxR family two component transcriptional regulator [Pseudoduganella lurida]